jgi:uncharacterized protein YciI
MQPHEKHNIFQRHHEESEPMTETFIVMAWDGPGSAKKRAQSRDAHFIHIEREMDRIKIAGPFRDEDGSAVGSLFVVKAEDKAAALRLFKSDPYFAAGVWERFEIQAFLPAAGEWIGGKIW